MAAHVGRQRGREAVAARLEERAGMAAAAAGAVRYAVTTRCEEMAARWEVAVAGRKGGGSGSGGDGGAGGPGGATKAGSGSRPWSG